MKGKAQDLKQTVKNLDPQDSLEIEELDRFYIARKGSPIKKLAIELEDMDDEKYLFTGHRGSGKSTELAKLQAILDDSHTVIRFSVKDYLDVQDLNYQDVLLAIFFATADYIEESNLEISGPVQSIIETLWDFGDDAERTVDASNTEGVEGEVGIGGFLSGILSLKGKFKSQSSTRETVRVQVNRKIQELLSGLDSMLREIERLQDSKILYIIEDLDKTDLNVADEIFYKHAQSLLEPKALIIYTFPIALLYSDNFQQVIQNFKVYNLPNFKLHFKDDRPNDEAIIGLQNILKYRVWHALFEDGAIDVLVKKCSGVPRILIQLARSAALEARVNDHEKIMVSDSEKAVAEERISYGYSLNDEREKLLKKVHADKEIQNTTEYRQLLHNLSIIEYKNDEVWHDVNALLLDLLKEDN